MGNMHYKVRTWVGSFLINIMQYLAFLASQIIFHFTPLQTNSVRSGVVDIITTKLNRQNEQNNDQLHLVSGTSWLQKILLLALK